MQSRTVVKRTAIPTPPRRWRSIRVSPITYMAVVLTIFLGVIGGAQTAGWWSTSGQTTSDGAPVQLTGTDPAEIKGWMTIGDVLTAYQVPRADLYARFAIPDSVPESAQLKSLEALAPDFSITELRAWLTERAAGP
jgi:hypothetical protein